jgi:hypothetical protein
MNACIYNSRVINLNALRRWAGSVSSAKINELETNSKNKNIRELYWRISDFKKD